MSFAKGYTPWNKKEPRPLEYIQCACGCGEQTEKFDTRGRLKKYKYKHGNRGRKFPTLKHERQFQKGHAPWNKGVKVENAGTYKKGHPGLKGEDNPLWKGGTSYLGQGFRKKPEYAKWRLAVFERDNYTCQLCLVRGGKLIADHHPYPFHSHPEKRLDLDNGRTLCVDCNYHVTYVTKDWASC